MSVTVTLNVDEKLITAPAGANLLQLCLDHGIYIPHLCYLPELEAVPASCRLCFVSVEGVARPLAACTLSVHQTMTVRTDTPEVRELQRAALRLLLSVHRVECYRCPAHKRCALQEMARFLRVGLKPRNLEPILKPVDIQSIHPLFDFYPNRCVLCGRCVNTCQLGHAQPVLSFVGRGLQTGISAHPVQEAMPCERCLACVAACPVAALCLGSGPDIHSLTEGREGPAG